MRNVRPMIGGLAAVALAVSLAGCQQTRQALGLEKTAPDEFQVVARAPLSLPPDYNLLPPQPGVARPQEGTTRDQAPLPLPFAWGMPSMGGPIATASGLVFVGAAMDDYLRAFDVETGEELWKGRLPAGGQATPMTYRVRADGKQYVVIAAGGNARMTTTLGDAVVAFALP